MTKRKSLTDDTYCIVCTILHLRKQNKMPSMHAARLYMNIRALGYICIFITHEGCARCSSPYETNGDFCKHTFMDKEYWILECIRSEIDSECIIREYIPLCKHCFNITECGTQE